MKKQQADKPIDEELLMRMMAGETEKPQGNGDAPVSYTHLTLPTT